MRSSRKPKHKFYCRNQTNEQWSALRRLSLLLAVTQNCNCGSDFLQLDQTQDQRKLSLFEHLLVIIGPTLWPLHCTNTCNQRYARSCVNTPHCKCRKHSIKTVYIKSAPELTPTS